MRINRRHRKKLKLNQKTSSSNESILNGNESRAGADQAAPFLSENALERLAAWSRTTPSLVVSGGDYNGMDSICHGKRHTRNKRKKSSRSEDGSWCDADSMEALDGTTGGSSISDFTMDEVLSLTVPEPDLLEDGKDEYVEIQDNIYEDFDAKCIPVVNLEEADDSVNGTQPKLTGKVLELHNSTSDSFPNELSKYWAQRYRLFSRFDEGIKIDEGEKQI